MQLINRYDGVLVCYDKDWKQLWSFKPSDTLRLSNSRNQFYVQDGVIYTAYMTGYIYALDAKDGSIFWEGKVGMDHEKLHFSSQSLKPENNIIQLTSRSNNNTYAINATTGELEWNYSMYSPNSYMPALANGNEVFISTDPIISKFNAQTGQLHDSKNFQENFGKMVHTDRVLIVPFETSKHIVALNPSDFNEVWRFELQKYSKNIGKNIFAINNHLFLASSKSKDSAFVYCLNIKDGAVVGQVVLKGKIESMEAIGEYIYGYTEDKKIFFFPMHQLAEIVTELKLEYQPVSNIELKDVNLYYYAKEGLIKFDLRNNKEALLMLYDGSMNNSRLNTQLYLSN